MLLYKIAHVKQNTPPLLLLLLCKPDNSGWGISIVAGN